jgi:hypothetical protein
MYCREQKKTGRQNNDLKQYKKVHCKMVVNIITYHHCCCCLTLVIIFFSFFWHLVIIRQGIFLICDTLTKFWNDIDDQNFLLATVHTYLTRHRYSMIHNLLYRNSKNAHIVLLRPKKKSSNFFYCNKKLFFKLTSSVSVILCHKYGFLVLLPEKLSF